jgi:uncharacterized protein (DUF433 family)
VLDFVHNVNERWVMATKAHGLRLPEEIEEEIGREMRLRGATFSEVATSLLREAVRMRRAPGVVFMDGATGRRAVIAGTGLDVWEIVAQYKEVEESPKELKECYPWLSEVQLSSALAYYDLYPEEIDARIEREEYWSAERLWEEHPFMRPR